jgi:hypothetical protein
MRSAAAVPVITALLLALIVANLSLRKRYFEIDEAEF